MLSSFAALCLGALLVPPPLRRSSCATMKVATKPISKGFGAKKVAPAKQRVVPLDPAVQSAIDELQQQGPPSLERYLNPALFEDPETMADVGRRLRAGEVVVLRDAFRPEFAAMVHAELSHSKVPWSLNEAYFADGYHHHHHNVYDQALWSARLNATFDVFRHDDSKRLMAELTGRDCGGEVTGAPSYYMAGDHSLPHTDWVGQRTVSYVWHLSKDWKPEWGGALYWAQNHHAAATFPASFNTLVLFSVTTRSAHFVTTVSPKHKGKRLTFNGWWNAEWMPQLDDATEAFLGDPQRRQGVTHTQLQAVTDLLADRFQNIDEARRERLQALRSELVADFFPDGRNAGIEA